MVLPEEIADAAMDGDVDTVRKFLAKHPERVGATGSLEYVINHAIPQYTGDAPHLNDALELAKAVRAAQSTSTSTRLTPWQKYCLLPPKELLRHRSLVARGRARERRRLRSKTPREISLLFAPSFPNELFWRVMAFWNPRH